MKLVPRETHSKCSHCKKFKMVYTLDIDTEARDFCWRCGQTIMNKYQEIEEATRIDPVYRAQVRRRTAAEPA